MLYQLKTWHAPPPSNTVTPRFSHALSQLASGAVLISTLAFSAGASAQSFLANKKFADTVVNANTTTTLTFDLFNSRAESLSATLTDSLPDTTPSGQLWFNPASAATVMQGSAGAGCTAGTLAFSDYLDDPPNNRARTVTITNAVTPPRPAGTTQPNCQIAIPVHIGSVASDENVTNRVPVGQAKGTNAAREEFVSDEFSATLSIQAPVNPLVVAKSFSPTLVAGGGTSRLTITVRNNTRPTQNLTGVAFADPLPGGLSAAGSPTFSPSCGSPGTSTAAGSTSVVMTGASLQSGVTCTIIVDVTAPETNGPLNNVIDVGTVTTTQGPSNAVAARATLNVRSAIKMTKAFGNAGGTSAWHTDEAPVPADLYGQSFNISPATASTNQPVAVRVYFSNPTTNELTNGQINDALPGNTVSVAGSVGGTCGNLPTTPVSAGLTTVAVSGFSVPAATNGVPGSCYVQFWVKTTAAMAPAINGLSNTDVQFAGGTTPATFPAQSTSASLNVSNTGTGPGPGVGYMSTQKSYVTASGTYTGTAPARVEKGEEFWMRVAVRNTVFDVDYTNGSVTDTLPAGLKVATPLATRVLQNPPAPYGDGASVASGCTVPGTVSVSTGGVITYSGWTLQSAAGPNNTSPRNQGCFYFIKLVSDDVVAPGGSDTVNSVRANDVSATNSVTTGTATAQADVTARAIVTSDLNTSKAFSPATIGVAPGATTRLTITFDNKNQSVPITGLAVSDPLPSSTAFGNLTVAAAPNVNNTCGGTLSADPGSPSVSLMGGTVAPNSSCVVEVDVVTSGGAPGAAASVTNTIPANTVANDQNQTNWEPVTATLSKSGTVGINVVKSFPGSSALGGRAVPLTLRFTTNPSSDVPQDQITVTDNLPAGMLVAPVPNLSVTCLKADGSLADVSIAGDRTSFTISGFHFTEHTDGAAPHNSCEVTLDMVLTTTGNKTNLIESGQIATDVFSTNPSRTEATLTAQPNTALLKQFEPREVAAGQPSTLTLSIVNVNTEARTDFDLIDRFPSGMTVAGPAQTTCGDGTLTAAYGSDSVSISGGDVGPNETCTITVPVQVAQEGAYLNGPSNITATSYIDTGDAQDELKAGPPLPTTAVPTLSGWSLLALLAALASLGTTRLRRRSA